MGIFNTDDGFLKSWIMSYGFRIAGTILFVILGLWIINKVSKFMIVFLRKTSTDAGIISFLNSAAKLSLKTILIISALSSVGFDVSSVMAAIGASLVTVGLALKDSLSNIASGVLLVIYKPFYAGDYIEVESVKGTVEKIEMMFTTLRSNDGEVIIVPNARLTANSIKRKSVHNICKVNLEYRVESMSNIADVKKSIQMLMLSYDKVLQLHPVNVELDDKKGDEGIIFSVRFWCEEGDKEELEPRLKDSVKSILSKYGIKFID